MAIPKFNHIGLTVSCGKVVLCISSPWRCKTDAGYDADRDGHCDGKEESYMSLCRVLRTQTCCAKVCSTRRSMEERLPSVQCWSASSFQSSDAIAMSRVALFEASESILDCKLRAHGPRL